MRNYSIVILARNEEANLQELLATLKFAKEIIVLNDKSVDQTAKIAKKAGARVIDFDLGDDFAAARNFGMKQAKYPWVLFLDADERLSRESAKYLANFEPADKTAAYYFLRRDWFWGQELKHGETGHTCLTRLVRKDRGVWQRPVHEIYITKHKIEKLNIILKHYPHPTIKSFLQHVNYYSTLNAQYFLKVGKQTNVIDMALTPLLKFIYTYFCRLGFLDGAAGFVYSFMMSFHSFLSRAKLYVLKDR